MTHYSITIISNNMNNPLTTFQQVKQDNNLAHDRLESMCHQPLACDVYKMSVRHFWKRFVWDVEVQGYRDRESVPENEEERVRFIKGEIFGKPDPAVERAWYPDDDGSIHSGEFRVFLSPIGCSDLEGEDRSDDDVPLNMRAARH